MPITPTGPASIQLSSIRTLLSQSATFQQWVEAANATEALQSAHVIGLSTPASNRTSYTRQELEELRPFALLNLQAGEGVTFNRKAMGQFVPTTKIVMAVEADIEAEASRNFDEIAFEYLNRLGAVVEEMLEAGEGEDFPLIQSARIQPPQRTPIEMLPSRGDFLLGMVMFDLGLRGR